MPLGRAIVAAASTSHRTAILSSKRGFSVTSAHSGLAAEDGVKFPIPLHLQKRVPGSSLVEYWPWPEEVGSIPIPGAFLVRTVPFQPPVHILTVLSRRVEPNEIPGVAPQRPEATCNKKQSDPAYSVAAGVNPQLPRRTRTIPPIRKLTNLRPIRQSFTGRVVGGAKNPDRWES